MGRWNQENLGCDGAQDTLADFCDDLFAWVIKILQSPSGHEFDDIEIDDLFVRIEIIFALSDRNMVTSAPLPDELRPLFGPYLQRWADYFIQAGHKPSEERRRVMQESFDRLITIAEGCSGSLEHRLDLISHEMAKRRSQPDTRE